MEVGLYGAENKLLKLKSGIRSLFCADAIAVKKAEQKLPSLDENVLLKVVVIRVAIAAERKECGLE